MQKPAKPSIRSEQLSIVRNTCAHHGRVWNRSFTPAGATALRTVPELACLPPGQSEKAFGAIAVTAAILERCSPGSGWASRVAQLIERELLALPGRHHRELGLPDAWDGLDLWGR